MMTTVARFQVPEEAYLFRAFLESMEIRAAVLDEHVVQWFWHLSNAVGGVRVVVAGADGVAAREAFREYQAALLVGPYPLSVPRCWPWILVLSFVLGVPALLFGRRRVSQRV